MPAVISSTTPNSTSQVHGHFKTARLLQHDHWTSAHHSHMAMPSTTEEQYEFLMFAVSMAMASGLFNVLPEANAVSYCKNEVAACISAGLAIAEAKMAEKETARLPMFISQNS